MSTTLAEPYGQHVDHLVRGFLPDPTICGSRSLLIRRLAEAGRLRPLHYGDVAVGSVQLSDDSHPVSADGKVQESLWMFGAMTEGIRYFTQYVPSPKSRARAFVDADRCARTILSRASQTCLPCSRQLPSTPSPVPGPSK